MEALSQQHKQTTHGYQKMILFSTFLWLFFIFFFCGEYVAEHMLDLGFMDFLTFFTSKVVKRWNSGIEEILGSVHIWREKWIFKEIFVNIKFLLFLLFRISIIWMTSNLFKSFFYSIHCFRWTIFHIHSSSFIFSFPFHLLRK